MANHNWILDVFDDIRLYAQQNNLQGIADGINEMRRVAETETTTGNDVNRHDKVLDKIIKTKSLPVTLLPTLPLQ